jgi:hypothetical protein
VKRYLCKFVISLLVSLAANFPRVICAVDFSSSPPPTTLLQAGDLIWPKKPVTIVPYNSRPGEAEGSAALSREKGTAAYLDQIRQNPKPLPRKKERYSALQTMTYEEFLAYYRGDRPPWASHLRLISVESTLERRCYRDY